MPTIVFILSANRSGSTWLGYVLGSHSPCAFVGEYFRGWSPELKRPCAWCLGSGRETCPVLDGIEQVACEDAYRFAFARLRKPWIADTSKFPSWAERFVAQQGEFDIRFVHLVRDPRGWLASEKRRFTRDVPALLRSWCDSNRDISRFLRQSGLCGIRVFYDEISSRPFEEFPALCRFLGFDFEPQALCYWRHEHHGFGANGASSVFLKRLRYADKIEHLVTCDDSFYAARGESLFCDERWKSQLSGEEKQFIEASEEIAGVLRDYGRALTEDGLRRLDPEAPL